MKRFALIFGAALTFTTATYAAPYQSGFGFSADIPSDWLVLSQNSLKNEANAINADDPKFIGIDRGLFSQVMEKIKNADMEVYYHKGFGAGGFVNNINVIKQSAQVPTDESQRKAACDQLPGVFSRYFGHPVSMYQCSLTRISGKNAVLLEFDGALQGTRSIQYQVQKSEGVSIIVTGTFTNGTVDRERAVFTQIATSMKMQ